MQTERLAEIKLLNKKLLKIITVQCRLDFCCWLAFSLVIEPMIADCVLWPVLQATNVHVFTAVKRLRLFLFSYLERNYSR